MTKVGVIPINDTLLALLWHPYFSFRCNNLDPVEVQLSNLVAIFPAGNKSLNFLVLVLLGICLCSLFSAVDGACETEEDLDFESCGLKDMKDEVLKVTTSCAS